MTSQVKLNYGGTDYIVKCTGVSVGYSPIQTSKANANWRFPVEVQTQGIENPIYTLQNVMLVEEDGHLTKEVLLNIITTPYIGTNKLYLTVDYGQSSSKLWLGVDGVTTSIPVVIRPFTINIPVGEVHDNKSYKYSLPSFNLVLMETA